MEVASQVLAAKTESADRDPHQWLAKVLTAFAQAEQALGRLCLGANLGIEKGSLANLAELRKRLAMAEDSRCRALENRIARWSANRPYRHLLAHATLHMFKDSAGREVVVTRHLPRDSDDVTPDRMWFPEERTELLRQVNNDSRSIADQVTNILANPALINRLRSPVKA